MAGRFQLFAAITLAAATTGCAGTKGSLDCEPVNSWSAPLFTCGGERRQQPAPAPRPEVESKPMARKRVEVRGNKIAILGKVQFATGSAELVGDSEGILDEVAQTLLENPQMTKVRVEGHTDSQGKKSYNTKLSQRRANTVRQYLIERGIEADRLVAKGYGPSKPIADNDTEAGREQNRRVEFTILE